MPNLSRLNNFRVLALPLNLAAQALSVLVQDPVGRHRALVPMLDPPQYSPDLLVDELAPKYVIEITLPRIEYLKSAVAVVESDERNVILLLSFTSLNERLPNRSAEASRELRKRNVRIGSSR